MPVSTSGDDATRLFDRSRTVRHLLLQMSRGALFESRPPSDESLGPSARASAAAALDDIETIL